MLKILFLLPGAAMADEETADLKISDQVFTEHDLSLKISSSCMVQRLAVDIAHVQNSKPPPKVHTCTDITNQNICIT